MGMVEDYYEKEAEEERRAEEAAASRPRGCGSEGGVCLMMVPIWLAGVFVFLWRSATGWMPLWMDDTMDVAKGLYFLGAFGSAVAGAILALTLVAILIVRIVHWRSGR